MRFQPFSMLLLASSGTVLTSLPAQSPTPSVHVRAHANDNVFLLLSAGRGPALRLGGVNGIVRLDLASLVVIPAAAPDRFGRSATPIPWAAGLPPQVLQCQAAVIAGTAVLLTRVFQPLVDQDVDRVDRSLNLGTAGPQGPFLFGLSRDEILQTLRHYGSPQSEDERVLQDMRRPFRGPSRPALVEEVGLENALRIEHEQWRLLMRRDPRPVVEAAVASLTEQTEDEYFALRFPTGIPDDSDFFDFEGSGPTTAAAGCTGEATKTSGDYRLKLTVKLKSFLGISYTGKATAKSYHKGFLGIWSGDNVDEIHVEGTLTVGALDCDFSQTETHDNKAKDKCSLAPLGTAAVTASAYADWGSSGPRLSTSACDD